MHSFDHQETLLKIFEPFPLFPAGSLHPRNRLPFCYNTLLLSSYFPSQIPDRWPVPYSTAVKAFFLLIFIPSPPNIRLIAQYRLLSISDNRSSEHLRIFKNFLKLIFISNILDQQLIPHCSLMLKISRIYYTILQQNAQFKFPDTHQPNLYLPAP